MITSSIKKKKKNPKITIYGLAINHFKWDEKSKADFQFHEVYIYIYFLRKKKFHKVYNWAYSDF